jgi:hypothetical protein
MYMTRKKPDLAIVICDDYFGYLLGAVDDLKRFGDDLPIVIIGHEPKSDLVKRAVTTCVHPKDALSQIDQIARAVSQANDRRRRITTK